MKKEHIRLVVRDGWYCRVFTSRRVEYILNRIAPVGYCIRP